MDDLAFLRMAERPDYESGSPTVRVVDLFSGCGGLSLGLAEAACRLGLGIDIALAVDIDASIARVFSSNFPKARVEACGVEELFDGSLGARRTETERRWRTRIGRVSWLHGGPPCQGHSDLNNHTRRDDPRNEFYERMARAAEVLAPSVVVIENVPAVRLDSRRVVDRATAALEDLGYRVAERVISFLDLGVPQRRKRHTLLALMDLDADPESVLDSLGTHEVRDLRWAIGDLIRIDEPEGLDVPAGVSPANQRRIQHLFERASFDLPNELRPECHQGDHSYKSMYGRLHWEEPAQTITTGFGSMGQGRYVHPSQPRTLTPHEAARIQGFPDWFDFTAGGLENRRGRWATMIGNAVPPNLTMQLGRKLLPHLGL